MSLEEALAANTAALEANTAALKAAAKGGGTSTATSTSGGKSEGAYKPKHTKEEMLALMNEVKEKVGKDDAVAIRDKVGKVAKLSELSDPKVIDAVYDAAEAKLKEAADADV